MGQEILYTSAPQGLRQGSSGFCTVGSTAGMEPNLAEFLEGFSGYPHPYKPPDPRTKDNPVNYSFIQWTIGGQRYYVLSRVCDAGLDHTGRTNLLAHHVALTRREIERLPGGPAHVMAGGELFITAWDKQLKTLPGQKPQGGEAPLAKCAAWEAAAGDAGYAGVLAEAAKDKGGRPVSVIYPAGTDVLALVAEAQSLLPSERRWNVTFATFYSRIYTSFDVQWRFLFHETTEAKQARRDPQAVVIDLCKPPLPQASGGDLVTAAREGRHVQRAAPQRAAREAPSAVSPPARGRRPAAPTDIGTAVESDLQLAPPAVLDDAALAAAGPTINPFQRSRQRSVWLHYALAGTGGGIMALLAFLLLVVFAPPAEPEIAGLPPFNAANNNVSVAPPPTPENTAPAPEITNDPPEAVVDPNPPPDDPAPPPPSVVEPISSATPSSSPPPMPIPVAPRDPFDDIVNNKRLKLILPPRGGAGGLSAGPGAGGSPNLAQVYVQSPAEMDLQLLGKEALFGSDAPKIVIEREDEGPARTWRVVKLPAGALGKKETIGTFKLAGQQLTFAWNPAVQPGAKPDALRHCLLEVSIGGEKRICRLSAPIQKDGIKLADVQTSPLIVDLPELDATSLASANSLKLELAPVELPAPYDKLPQDEPLPIDGEQRVLIKGANNDEGPRVEFTVRFVADPQRPQRRVIVVTGKGTYRPPDVSEEDAMKALGGPLDMKRISAGVREYNDKAQRFELNVRRQKSKLDEFEKEVQRQAKTFDQQLKALRGLKEKKDDMEHVKKQKEMFETQRDERKVVLVDAYNAEVGGQKEAKATATAFESLGKLMSDTAAKGRLEFRIFFEIDGELVELYRSKGFPQEL
jgi:hypothetical protein